jgi:hypothetical protein
MENKVVDGNVQDACILATAWQDNTTPAGRCGRVRPRDRGQELTRQVRPRTKDGMPDYLYERKTVDIVPLIGDIWMG